MYNNIELEKFINKWFSTRNLISLPYQTEALLNVNNVLFTNTLPTVLGACPSAGKTYMTQCFIDYYLTINPKSKVLILAHGTKVLRANFITSINKVKPNFYKNFLEIEEGSHIKNIKKETQVVVAIPQSINIVELKKKFKFDLLVVDEAHQFYFAEKMVQNIIKNIKPKHQILLTGTPSKFIYREFPIVPVTVSEVYEHGMISNTVIELISSPYNFSKDDYNEHYELKTKVRFNQQDTYSSLDNLLDNMFTRLQSELVNNPEMYAKFGTTKAVKFLSKAKKRLFALNNISKTMIACKSIKQANQVSKYFKEQNIKVALSTSENDINSDEMKNFKNDPECLILIVVNRGILGFDYTELTNVVDMTGSENIDTIFQLMARVFRNFDNPKDKGKPKMFFKVSPHLRADWIEHVMFCTLCLTHKDYYLKYNGKNFLEMETLVKIEEKKKPIKGNSIGGSCSSNNKKKKKTEIKCIDFIGLPLVTFFKDILHKNHKPFAGYAYTTIKDVRHTLLSDSEQVYNGYWNIKENCINDALIYDTITKWIKSSSRAYEVAKKNGWLEECTKHMIFILNKWNEDKVLIESLKFKTKSEWAKNGNGSYHWAKKNKLLFLKCIKHMDNNIKISGYWNIKENCINDALIYENIKEWREKSISAYESSIKNGWLEECTKHMEKGNNKWSKENCLEIALKYNKSGDWRKYNSRSYNAAASKGWLEECTKHMEKGNKWDKNKCLEISLLCKTKKEFRKLYGGSVYNAAASKGWLEECTKHMELKKVPNNFLTKNMCLEDALKCNYKTEWNEKYPKTYYKAKRNIEWFEECTKHMKRPEVHNKITK